MPFDFFPHQLLCLFDDAKMPRFTFIITRSHYFRKKSFNYISTTTELRGQSPHFEELSPSCFYFERSPSRFRQSVIAPLRHLTNTAEIPLQSSRGCEEVSLFPTPSSRPICQIGFKPHESLRLCHRRAARFIALAWVSCMLMDFSPRASLQSMSALFDRRRLSGFHHRPSAYL